MAVTKQSDGRWLVSCRPMGATGPYVRRLCKTRSKAVSLERELLSKSFGSMDNGLLSECVKAWYDYFGVSLKDGEKRLSKLLHLVNLLGDSKVNRFSASDFLTFRKFRLDSGASPNTCNHDLAYFKTVFNKLVKSGYLSASPLRDVMPLKVDDFEFSYLTVYQFKRLLVCCRNSRNESLFPVVLLCLATGARWSEAEKLHFSNIGFGSIRFSETKNGKSRTVPVYDWLTDLLRSRPRWGSPRVFADCYSAFRAAMIRSKIQLPRGQMAHVLRHTFASHFVMNGGDILTLQRLLGHSDVKVTMRYAHLSPDHLRDALRFNPLSNFK